MIVAWTSVIWIEMEQCKESRESSGAAGDVLARRVEVRDRGIKDGF